MTKRHNVKVNQKTEMGDINVAIASLVLGICALALPFIGLGWLSVIVYLFLFLYCPGVIPTYSLNWRIK